MKPSEGLGGASLELGNLFVSPGELAHELVESLLAADGVRIERIVSRGQVSPTDFWYDQDQQEWVVVLKGRAVVCFDGPQVTQRLEVGDWLKIPAHRKHRVDWTDPDQETVWLAVFLPA